MRAFTQLVDYLIETIPRPFWASLTVGCAWFILYMGMRPDDDLGMVTYLPPGSDKVLHFVAYAGLAACVFRSLYPIQAERKPYFPCAWSLIILVPMALGILDEVFQASTPGRASDPLDWLADTAGGVFVCVGAMLWRMSVSRR